MVAHCGVCSRVPFPSFQRTWSISFTTPFVRDVDIWSQLVAKKSEATGTKENYCDEKQLKACVLTRLSGGSFDLLCRREARVFNRCSLNVQKQSADYWSGYVWQQASKGKKGEKERKKKTICICRVGRASVGRQSPFLLSNLSLEAGGGMRGIQGGDKRMYDG